MSLPSETRQIFSYFLTMSSATNGIPNANHVRYGAGSYPGCVLEQTGTLTGEESGKERIDLNIGSLG